MDFEWIDRVNGDEVAIGDIIKYENEFYVINGINDDGKDLLWLEGECLSSTDGEEEAILSLADERHDLYRSY